jgi:hypothetical protein
MKAKQPTRVNQAIQKRINRKQEIIELLERINNKLDKLGKILNIDDKKG